MNRAAFFSLSALGTRTYKYPEWQSRLERYSVPWKVSRKSSILVDVVFYYFLQRPVIGAKAYTTILFCTPTTGDDHRLEERTIFRLSLSSHFFVTSCMVSMIILYLLYVLFTLSSIFCSDRETRWPRRQTIHQPFVWIQSAAANVFPRIEEYALTEPFHLGSRNIDAYVCPGVKSVIRAAEKAEAGAGDLRTCPSTKRIRNGRVDTASSLETEVMVALGCIHRSKESLYISKMRKKRRYYSSAN